MWNYYQKTISFNNEASNEREKRLSLWTNRNQIIDHIEKHFDVSPVANYYASEETQHWISKKRIGNNDCEQYKKSTNKEGTDLFKKYKSYSESIVNINNNPVISKREDTISIVFTDKDCIQTVSRCNNGPGIISCYYKKSNPFSSDILKYAILFDPIGKIKRENVSCNEGRFKELKLMFDRSREYEKDIATRRVAFMLYYLSHFTIDNIDNYYEDLENNPEHHYLLPLVCQITKINDFKTHRTIKPKYIINSGVMEERKKEIQNDIEALIHHIMDEKAINSGEYLSKFDLDIEKAFIYLITLCFSSFFKNQGNRIKDAVKLTKNNSVLEMQEWKDIVKKLGLEEIEP